MRLKKFTLGVLLVAIFFKIEGDNSLFWLTLGVMACVHIGYYLGYNLKKDKLDSAWNWWESAIKKDPKAPMPIELFNLFFK